MSKRKKEELVEKEREENEDKAGEKEELTRKVIVEKEELARKRREEVTYEEKYFKLRVDQYLSNLDEGAEFLEDIEKNISEVKYLIEMHGELHCKLELVLGDEYEDEFGDKFKDYAGLCSERKEENQNYQAD